MPHCIIDYSKELETTISPSQLIEAVFKGAVEAALFSEKDIKVRASSFENYKLPTTVEHFIYVCIRILSGRTQAQRKSLSDTVSFELKKLTLKSVSLSIEVVDMERESYTKELI
jgi:5-carboxymethyl-2-hydroxymuconate isomerase